MPVSGDPAFAKRWGFLWPTLPVLSASLVHGDGRAPAPTCPSYQPAVDGSSGLRHDAERRSADGRPPNRHVETRGDERGG